MLELRISQGMEFYRSGAAQEKKRAPRVFKLYDALQSKEFLICRVDISAGTVV